MNTSENENNPYKVKYRRPSLSRNLSSDDLKNESNSYEQPRSIHEKSLNGSKRSKHNSKHTIGDITDDDESISNDELTSCDSNTEEESQDQSVSRRLSSTPAYNSKTYQHKYTPESNVPLREKTNSYTIIMCVVFGVLALIAAVVGINSISEEPLKIEDIKKEFAMQDNEVWITFESGLQDIFYLNRPSTFIYLYEKQHEEPINKLVKRLGYYAKHKLSKSADPIILTDKEINSPKILKDFGELIHIYKPQLERSGVMIVKHLEKMSGKSAKAFHYFCDEFNPLVYESLFIFTMQVEKLPKNSFNFVNDYLKNKWVEDIDEDTYNALITRITSMIVNVKFE